ncbi:response regulator [Terriglobus roseus]|uniref:Response regulator receiver domain-containing protein n=1 Tax=Terriglobus roseus TaxID=392734 RepID=A0A1H4QUD8_9BACT|nr:response regulator [Terriglobus roseus]SEC23279.1 Response regulator receiver domain-containing protein [Terriglobus roseus]
MLHHYEMPTDYGLTPGVVGESPMPLGDENHADPRRETHLPRVLVVDDERLIADTLTQILNMHGFDAFCAYSGAAALDLAEVFRPDYLLTDVMMPKLNGVELALAMERIFPSIRVMLISGQAGSHQAQAWQKSNGTAFAVAAKPIHPEKLIMQLRSLEARG